MKNFLTPLVWLGILLLSIGCNSDSPAPTTQGQEKAKKLTKAEMLKAQVFVAQDSGDPSLYEFTVVNNSKSSIFSLMLGTSSNSGAEEDFELSLEPRLIPEKGFAPPGWKFQGGVEGITGYETEKIKYLWQPENIKNKESFIPAGSTGIFKLKMPGPTEELMNISFKVDFYSPFGFFGGRVEPK